jgi:hypothetical protein
MALRRPNRNDPTPLHVTVPVQPHELSWLKRNTEPRPKADGKRRPMGGYPLMENWCLDAYDPATGTITFDPIHFERLWTYISPKYGQGGPNGRLRRCFIPALRRIGRDPLPDWAA